MQTRYHYKFITVIIMHKATGRVGLIISIDLIDIDFID